MRKDEKNIEGSNFYGILKKWAVFPFFGSVLKNLTLKIWKP